MIVWRQESDGKWGVIACVDNPTQGAIVIEADLEQVDREARYAILRDGERPETLYGE